jgi:hypothetical protein
MVNTSKAPSAAVEAAIKKTAETANTLIATDDLWRRSNFKSFVSRAPIIR